LHIRLQTLRSRLIPCLGFPRLPFLKGGER